jgi:hypothetical protein
MISKFKFFEGIIKDTFIFDNINTLTTHVPRSERTLRAMWSPELEQDIEFYHGIDIEDELTRLLSGEIARSIDDDIIAELTRRINGGQRA